LNVARAGCNQDADLQNRLSSFPMPKSVAPTFLHNRLEPRRSDEPRVVAVNIKTGEKQAQLLALEASTGDVEPIETFFAGHGVPFYKRVFEPRHDEPPACG
jgi:hypothetical protein